MKEEVKLEAIVRCIAWRCGSRRDFGRVMLCGLYYFSDFGSFELRRRSISRTMYVVAAGGMEPAKFSFLLDDMVRRKVLSVTFHHGSETYTSLSAPDLSLLTQGTWSRCTWRSQSTRR